MPIYEQLFDWCLDIPKAISEFTSWLNQPIWPDYINVTPLGLLGIGGASIIITIIVIHVVKLFVDW